MKFLQLSLAAGLLLSASSSALAATVYFEKPSDWTTVYAYTWNAGSGGTDSQALSTTDIDGHTLYVVDTEKNLVIFKNDTGWSGDGKTVIQTEDLSATDGAVYGSANIKKDGSSTDAVANIVNGKYVPAGQTVTTDPVLYMRGMAGTNDPVEGNKMSHEEGTTIYTWTGNVVANTKFKICSDTWGSWEYGYSSITNIASLSEYIGNPNDYNNMMILKDGQNITFTIDIDSNTRTLAISGYTDPVVADEVLYFRGSWDDYAASRKMDHVDGTKIYSWTGAIENGQKFKIANADWNNGYNWGGEFTIEDNGTYTLYQNHSGNVTLGKSGSNVKFTLDITNMSAPTLSVSGYPKETEGYTTIYFSDVQNWAAGEKGLYCYLYGDGDDNNNANYPGQKITATEGNPQKVGDFTYSLTTVKNEENQDVAVYVITYPTAKHQFTKVVFNSNDQSQTGGSPLKRQVQTADCVIENNGVYSNDKREGVGNCDMNYTRPLSFYIGNYVYRAEQSDSMDKYTFFYNSHLDWEKCYMFIKVESGTFAEVEMKKGTNQFGRECWMIPAEAASNEQYGSVTVNSSIRGFVLWFNNNEDQSQGYNTLPQDGTKEDLPSQHYYQGDILQNFSIYEDVDGVKPYNDVMKLYVKGNVFVGTESAKETPRELTRNPQTGRFYANVKPDGDGKFYLIRSTDDDAESKFGDGNYWGTSNPSGETLVAGAAPLTSLSSRAEGQTEPYAYTLSQNGHDETVLVVKVRDRFIQNLIPDTGLEAAIATETEDVKDVRGNDAKGVRCQRNGGVRINIMADNYFDDFSKTDLKFEYVEENGVTKPEYYQEPTYFGIHEGTATVADVDANTSLPVIGTYRVFFNTPGTYKITATNEATHIYAADKKDLGEITAYATPTSVQLKLNYSAVTANADNAYDVATYSCDNFPNYYIPYFWSFEPDNNSAIKPATPALGSVVKTDAKLAGNDYAFVRDGIKDNLYYLVINDENVRCEVLEEVVEDLNIWYKYTTGNEKNAPRRAASDDNGLEGYTKYNPLTGMDLSNENASLTVKLQQLNTLSEPYAIELTRAGNVATEVESIAIEDAADVEAVYYNLNGVRVSGENLTPGIYVEVRGQQTRKIVVR